MAKKNGDGNKYKSIKNPELLQGQPDRRTPKQQAADGKNPNVRKDGEKWQEQVKRTMAENKEKLSDRANKAREYHHGKDLSKEPEKDK